MRAWPPTLDGHAAMVHNSPSRPASLAHARPTHIPSAQMLVGHTMANRGAFAQQARRNSPVVLSPAPPVLDIRRTTGSRTPTASFLSLDGHHAGLGAAHTHHTLAPTMPLPGFVGGICEEPLEQPRRCRRHAEHYCGWDRCCFKFRQLSTSRSYFRKWEQAKNAGGLCAKDFEHLPVCHLHCWQLERDRLRAQAEREGTWPAANKGLLTCHRVCYMRELGKVVYPELGDVGVVPLERSWKELLLLPELSHLWARVLTLTGY